MRRRRSARPTALTALVVVLLVGAVAAPPAGAAGDGGGSASSSVTRDGRIITSIVTRGSTGTTPVRRPGAPPRVRWLTLGDLQVAYLLQLLATDPTLADHPLLALLGADDPTRLGGGATVQVRLRDGAVDDGPDRPPAWRVLPEADVSRLLGRRMVTVLPVLTPELSPPLGAPALVGVPTFVSFSPAVWATVVDRTLTAGGVTARVRARPVSTTVRSADPGDVGGASHCDGPGTPFRPLDPRPPAVQARAGSTCTLTYLTATGVDGRRPTWLGDVTVWWRAEWSTDGVTWRSLGLVPRLATLPRRVVEAEPVLRTPG